MSITSINGAARSRRLSLWIAALTALLVTQITACGGGGGSSGGANTASTSTSITEGTVNGFASVIVDGQEVEDATSTTRVENADGSFSNVALKLGQRVHVTQSVSGAVTGTTSILVQAALIGSVSNINTSAGEFKAAGQWVKTNTDSTAGPLTVYAGGYSGLTSLAANDLVEVHGSATYSTAKAAYVIQASRIDKQASISAVRINGKVASLDATAKTFALNGVTVNYSAATMVPTGSTLANDQTVFVWGPSGSLTGGSAPVLAATRLRINTSTTSTTVVSGTGQISGLASAYNATAKTFEIDGVVVNAATATMLPTGASLASGAYVSVSGTFGSGGVLTATSIRVRQQDTSTALASIRLHGAISSYVSNTSFVVRGVPVDASAITLAAACPGVTLANDVVVDITATQQTGTDVLKATSLRCQSSASGYTMCAQQGTAGTVDTAAKTFVLTKTSGTQKVQWSDQTAWGTGVTANTLATVTSTVVVEGYLDTSNVLVARSVRLLGTSDVDRYSPDTGPIYCASTTGTGVTSSTSTTTTGISSITMPCGKANEGWDNYDATHRPGKR